MSDYSLIYVSHSLLAPDAAEAAIDDIIATSVARNGREAITGALLYTGTNFVQILEGPEAAVQRLMDGIRRDPRHDQVDVLDTTVAPGMFEGWSMAYIGDATYVTSHVRALIHEPKGSAALAEAVRRMRRLMHEMVHASQ